MARSEMAETEGRSIAVVIATYNRAATIERCIDSVLAQRRPADQIIVVDDGSTDDTIEILARYGDRIEIVRTTNGGAALARNRGVTSTSSTWIAFLDSDDFWFPDHLERIESAITATNGEANVYFDDTIRPAEGRPDASLFALASFTCVEPWHLAEDATDWVVRPRQPLMLQSSVIRRRSWDGVGGLWPVLRSRHDTHLFLRLGIAQPMCAVAGAGCQMTDDDHSGNRQMDVMGPTTRAYWHHTVELYRDVLNRHQHDLTDDAQATLKHRIARGYLTLARHDARAAPISSIRSISRAVRLDLVGSLRAASRRISGPRS
ncbi:MAG: glycosyltransferase [Actinomycetota bacterium]